MGGIRLAGICIAVAGALALGACEEKPSSTSETSGEAASPEAAKAPAGRRLAKYFEYESGMVEYALSGVRSGTEVLYWDDWGGRQARYTKASLTMMSITQTTDDWVITLPDVVYAIDMKTKTATRSVNPAKAFAEGLSEDELEEIGRRMTEAMGAKKVGTDTVAGLSCEIWRTEALSTETCTHKNVPLRSKSGMGGMQFAIVATKIELDASVDQSHFQVPADVTVREAPEIPAGMLDAMKKGMTAPEDGE
jgi:hypothetical protein